MAIAIGLGVMAVLSPWWSLSGQSLFEGAETDNLYPLDYEVELYLVQPSAVETTSFEDWVVVEEIHQMRDSLDATFLLLLITVVLLAIGYILVLGDLLLSNSRKYRRRALTKNIAFGGLIVLILGVVVSIAGIFVTCGLFAGLAGSGTISGVKVPGSEAYVDVLSTYGFGYGFYFALISIGFAFVGYWMHSPTRK